MITSCYLHLEVVWPILHKSSSLLGPCVWWAKDNLMKYEWHHCFLKKPIYACQQSLQCWGTITLNKSLCRQCQVAWYVMIHWKMHGSCPFKSYTPLNSYGSFSILLRATPSDLPLVSRPEAFHGRFLGWGRLGGHNLVFVTSHQLPTEQIPFLPLWHISKAHRDEVSNYTKTEVHAGGSSGAEDADWIIREGIWREQSHQTQRPGNLAKEPEGCSVRSWRHPRPHRLSPDWEGGW